MTPYPLFNAVRVMTISCANPRHSVHLVLFAKKSFAL